MSVSQVLRSCIAAMFECRYADARKSFPGVLRALRAPSARAALVRDLAARLPSNKHLLHHHQFELVVRYVLETRDQHFCDEHKCWFNNLKLLKIWVEVKFD